MALSLHALSIFFLITSISAAAAKERPEVSDDLPTAYELLEEYDFPKGILPEGVQSYLLQKEGSFDVYFSGDCEFKVRGYLLRYSRKITGTVQPGSLTRLKGVRVKVLFLWFGIDSVAVSGDQLSFFVGPLSASFPLSNFEECPRCRCGFDCTAAAASVALVADS